MTAWCAVLLPRRTDGRLIVSHCGEVVGPLGERVDGIRQQVGRRSVPGNDEQYQQVDAFLLGEISLIDEFNQTRDHPAAVELSQPNDFCGLLDEIPPGRSRFR